MRPYLPFLVRASLLLGLVAWATTASAQVAPTEEPSGGRVWSDEFGSVPMPAEGMAPPVEPIPVTPTPPPPVVRRPEPATVRVLAFTGVALRTLGTGEGARELAVPTTSESLGTVIDARGVVAVPFSAVASASLFAIRTPDGRLRATRVLHRDEEHGFALLVATGAWSEAATLDALPPPTTAPLEAVVPGDGGPSAVRHVPVARSVGSTLAFTSPDPAVVPGTPVVEANGGIAGMIVRVDGDAFFVDAGTLSAARDRVLGSLAPPTGPEIDWLGALLTIAGWSDLAQGDAWLGRTEGPREGASARAVSADTAREPATLLAAALLWDAGEILRDATRAGAARMRAYLLCLAMKQADPEGLGRTPFVERVLRETPHGTGVAGVPVRRLRVPTVLLSAGLGFARASGIEVGGASLVATGYWTFPFRGYGALVRGGLAAGASLGLGVSDASFLLLATADVGASLRVGHRLGFFGHATWSPGVLFQANAVGSAFAVASFRALAGLAWGRRVAFLGYRVMAPQRGYAYHALEAGVGFRF